MTIDKTSKVRPFLPALATADKLEKGDKPLDTPQATAIVGQLARGLENEFAGASSSAGLADAAKTMAQSARSVFQRAKARGALTDGARAVFEETFGKKLDGKTPAMQQLIASIRSETGARGFVY